jgi:diaminopimelate epimerase
LDGVASALVVADRSGVTMVPLGANSGPPAIPFVKMTGSGNDFVFFDGRLVPLEVVNSPEMIRAICNRNNGIGADGLVVLEPEAGAAQVRIHYYNSDGTPADLCGNATLCSTALAAELGLSRAAGMSLATPAGLIQSRLTSSGPEIDLRPVTDMRPEMPIGLSGGETRIGFALAGIPHLVVLCDEVARIDVEARGPILRHHAACGAGGANVNWVSAMPDGHWRYRTFERGVEGETLACGTGAVATAVLLAQWGVATPPTIRIQSSSGKALTVSLRPLPSPELPGFAPTLHGEGRVVFRGTLANLDALR